MCVFVYGPLFHGALTPDPVCVCLCMGHYFIVPLHLTLSVCVCVWVTISWCPNTWPYMCVFVYGPLFHGALTPDPIYVCVCVWATISWRPNTWLYVWWVCVWATISWCPNTWPYLCVFVYGPLFHGALTPDYVCVCLCMGHYFMVP